MDGEASRGVSGRCAVRAVRDAIRLLCPRVLVVRVLLFGVSHGPLAPRSRDVLLRHALDSGDFGRLGVLDGQLPQRLHALDARILREREHAVARDRNRPVAAAAGAPPALRGLPGGRDGRVQDAIVVRRGHPALCQ